MLRLVKNQVDGLMRGLGPGEYGIQNVVHDESAKEFHGILQEGAADFQIDDQNFVAGNEIREIDASALADYPANYWMGNEWFEPGKRARAEFLLPSVAERVEPRERFREKVEEFLFAARSVAREPREQNLSDSCTGRPGSKKPD